MKKYFFYSIIIIFYSCEKVINIDTDYSDERIVLDASIFKNINEDFATAIVMVSKTAPYFDENNTLTAEAEVYVKTKNGNINLIYNSEKKYYTNKISYINYEEDYEFFVKLENQNYYSSEKLIKVSGIESVVFGDRKSLNKDEIELLITFTDPKEIVDFNLWKFGPKGNGDNYDYLLSRDLYTNGNQFTFSFFIDKTKYFKNNEFSAWNRIPLGSAGWVSEAGELKGLNNIKPQKQIEIQPFVVTKLDSYEAEAGNPYADGNDFNLNAGLDAKIGITNDLTLDVTINPDFGQVEADPAAINLDGFEIFNRDQRPFFVENKNIYSLY